MLRTTPWTEEYHAEKNKKHGGGGAFRRRQLEPGYGSTYTGSLLGDEFGDRSGFETNHIWSGDVEMKLRAGHPTRFARGWPDAA